jgi:hypothetical protein
MVRFAADMQYRLLISCILPQLRLRLGYRAAHSIESLTDEA